MGNGFLELSEGTRAIGKGVQTFLIAANTEQEDVGVVAEGREDVQGVASDADTQEAVSTLCDVPGCARYVIGHADASGCDQVKREKTGEKFFHAVCLQLERRGHRNDGDKANDTEHSNGNTGDGDDKSGGADESKSCHGYTSVIIGRMLGREGRSPPHYLSSSRTSESVSRR